MFDFGVLEASETELLLVVFELEDDDESCEVDAGALGINCIVESLLKLNKLAESLAALVFEDVDMGADEVSFVWDFEGGLLV